MRTGYKLSKKDLETHEAARTALAEARKLLPGWRAAARMLSRNNSLQVHLQAGGTACTDGKQVWLRVPAELAAVGEHDRALCGIRGSDKVLLCPACDVLEDVNITIIHEIAHMVFDTFEEVSAYEQSKLIEYAIMIGAQGQPESARAAKIKARIEAMDIRERNNYLSLSDAISPFLPLLINAGEDIRVNTLMQRERPGTRVMFDAQTQKVFRDGILGYDGKRTLWRDAPLNAQAMIGVYCKVGDFDWRNSLRQEVVEAIDDPELDEICDKLRDAKSVRQVYRLSIPLLECLRRLGFMRDEEDPEDDPGEGEQSDEGDSSDEDSQQESDGEASDQAEGDSADQDGAEASDDASVDSDTEDEPSDSESEGDGQSEGDSDDSESASGDSEEDSRDDTSDSGESEGDPTESDSDSEESDESAEPGDGSSSEESGSGSVQSEHEDDSESSDGDDTSADMEDDGTDAGDDSSPSDAADPVESSGEPPESPPDGSSVDPGSEGPESMDDDTRDASESPQNDGKDTRDSGFDASSDEMGTPEEVERLLTVFGRHEEVQASPSGAIEQQAFEDAVEMAIEQMDFFDSPSLRISGVKEHKFKDRQAAWQPDHYFDNRNVSISVSEGEMSKSLQRLRILFTDNARGRQERNRRTGKVDGRVLAKRAPAGDDRLFKKNIVPGRRDYFVLIGLDVSGSTSAGIGQGLIRLDMMKAAARAKAEMLTRLGIPFAMYAHSGDMNAMEIFEIKGPKERWGRQQNEALDLIKPYSANLDGHTLEYYRKVMQKRNETDRLILYYTDGAMPAANYQEELEILQREIKTCEQQGIHLVGVGVQSDSPKEHGLDTILLNDLDDVSTVVDELRKRLM